MRMIFFNRGRYWLVFCMRGNSSKKKIAMKNLLVLLLFSVGMFAQPTVFNVQKYCVDNKPFKSGECDISGNEYSFVFLDAKAKSVVFFFTDTKLKYEIVSATTNSSGTNYSLKSATDIVQMHINKAKNNIEFLYPNMKIHLVVGASTKYAG